MVTEGRILEQERDRLCKVYEWRTHSRVRDKLHDFVCTPASHATRVPRSHVPVKIGTLMPERIGGRTAILPARLLAMLRKVSLSLNR